MDFQALYETVREYLFTRQVVGLEAWRVCAAVLAFLVIYAARRFIVALIMGFFARLTKRTKTDWDDLILEAVTPPVGAALQVANVYVALALLRLPRTPIDYRSIVNRLVVIAMIIIVCWAAVRSVSLLTRFLQKMTAKTTSSMDDRLIPFVDRFLRVILIILGALMILQESGIQIAGILAGLGIGGLAIALAAKDMLANIFGTITIITDHPFDIGDWIKTPHVEGTVEDIGFRSTRVRTFGNSLVSVPNSAIAGSAVENFSRMFKRRITFRIGVTYETTPVQMREALARLRDVVRNHEDIRQDFWLVYFTDFADSTMEIMIYCFTKTTVWAEFLAVRESLNLLFIEALEEIGVEFAFPSRAVYMREDDADERSVQSERCAAMLEKRALKDLDESAGEDLSETDRRGAG